jgi:hypothetical protein
MMIETVRPSETSTVTIMIEAVSFSETSVVMMMEAVGQYRNRLHGATPQGQGQPASNHKSLIKERFSE